MEKFSEYIYSMLEFQHSAWLPKVMWPFLTIKGCAKTFSLKHAQHLPEKWIKVLDGISPLGSSSQLNKGAATTTNSLLDLNWTASIFSVSSVTSAKPGHLINELLMLVDKFASTLKEKWANNTNQHIRITSQPNLTYPIQSYACNAPLPGAGVRLIQSQGLFSWPQSYHLWYPGNLTRGRAQHYS